MNRYGRTGLAAVIGALCLLIGLAHTAAAQTSPVELLQALAVAYNTGDLAQAEALVAPGTVFKNDPGTPAAQEANLSDFIKQGQNGSRVTLTNAQLTAPDTVVADTVLSGPGFPPLPHPFTGVTTITVANGKITSFVFVTSNQTRADLAALAPPPGMPTSGQSDQRGGIALLIGGLLAVFAGGVLRRARRSPTD